MATSGGSAAACPLHRQAKRGPEKSRLGCQLGWVGSVGPEERMEGGLTPVSLTPPSQGPGKTEPQERQPSSACWTCRGHPPHQHCSQQLAGLAGLVVLPVLAGSLAVSLNKYGVGTLLVYFGGWQNPGRGAAQRQQRGRWAAAASGTWMWGLGGPATLLWSILQEG